MIDHQDELTREFEWFNFDRVWDYLHNDEIHFDANTNPSQFVTKMKPILQRFLESTGRWTTESVLWKLHHRAEMAAILPASRSDGTSQDLWSNVIMTYSIRPNYLSLPPVKAAVISSIPPSGQSSIERAA
jgi:hypothetical protein